MIISSQRGTTVISLLVGMVISMLAILACLSMFHSLVVTSAEAKSDARQEGDLSLAVLRLETELQAAGFNMGRERGPAGRNLDFQTVTSTGRSDVAWRFNDGANFICRRATSKLFRGNYTLELFTAAAGKCTAAWPLDQSNIEAEANWIFTERFVDLTLYSMGTQSTFSQPLITFTAPSAQDRPCMPFGAVASGAAADKHPILNLGVFDVATVNNPAATASTLPSRPHSLCLANIFL